VQDHRLSSSSLLLFLLLCATIAGSLVFLASCGQTVGMSSPGHALRGQVNGGQQGVNGATIQLYAAGDTGYGSAATSLLTTAVTTNPAGSFSITGDYMCPSASTQVYIVATGGNPGLSPGTNNTALAMMAALGPCGNLTSSTFIFMDEVTTVASVYALAPFMAVSSGTPGAMLGTSSTNSQGLANAFATVNNLIDTTKGEAPGLSLPTGATAPSTEVNTLADMLATCVNSNGSSGECSTLFTDATPSGGSAPTNTIDAILDIAQHPAQNVSTLFGLVTGTAPFQPTLASAPNDWTMAVKYIGGGLTAPTGIAVDGSGNIWVANGGVYPAFSGGNNSISKFSATGTAISTSSGYTGGGLGAPFGIAIDPSGNVWAPRSNGSALAEFSSSGSALSGTNGYTGGGLSAPYGIAINGSGVVFAANGGNVSGILNTGSAQSGSPYGSGSNLFCIAIDGSGNVWTTDEVNPGTVIKMSSAGTVAGTYSVDGQNGAWGVAIDGSSQVWVSNSASNTVTALTSSGSVVSSYGGGGLSTPENLIVDGLGNIWVADEGGNQVSEFSNSGSTISPSTGFTGGGMSKPYGIAVDGSGNVWVTNNASGSNSITEIVGAAAPLVTPLSVAAGNNTLGVRP